MYTRLRIYFAYASHIRVHMYTHVHVYVYIYAYNVYTCTHICVYTPPPMRLLCSLRSLQRHAHVHWSKMLADPFFGMAAFGSLPKYCLFASGQCLQLAGRVNLWCTVSTNYAKCLHACTVSTDKIMASVYTTYTHRHKLFK